MESHGLKTTIVGHHFQSCNEVYNKRLFFVILILEVKDNSTFILLL